MAFDFGRIIQSRAVIAENLRNDFGAFCRAAWPHVHKGRGKQLSWTWAHDLIAEYMVALHNGDIFRLIVNCPPRFAKSTIISILFPVWCWLRNPSLAFIAASYEIDLSTTHNGDRRRLITSEWFQSLFADRFQLSTDRSLASEFGNTAGGTMMAASANSKMMGRGGDFILLDDILSADMAYSDAQRGEVLDWLQHMVPQRLNNPATSRICLVMQRLHQADPTGDLLEREPGEWTLLKLPLIAEEDERWVFPISKRVVVRRAGECLDSKRFPSKVVRERQRNRLVWSGQYQQEPAPIEGNLIKTDDVQYYGGRGDAVLPDTFDKKIISVDCTFKDTRTSDFVGILVVGTKGPRRYILNIVNERLDLDGTERAILSQHAIHGPISAVLVEDAANGSAVISHLKEKIAGVIARSAQGGKMARMMASAPTWQGHGWYVDRTAHWTNEIVDQVTSFPNAKHDDLVDSMTQTEIWLQENSHDYGLLDWAKGLMSGTRTIKNLLSKPSLVEMVMPSTPLPNGLCCANFTRQLLPGGITRCGNCGRQSDEPVPVLSGPCACDPNLTISIAGGLMHCNGCSSQWYPTDFVPRKPYRPTRKNLPYDGDRFSFRGRRVG